MQRTSSGLTGAVLLDESKTSNCHVDQTLIESEDFCEKRFCGTILKKENYQEQMQSKGSTSLQSNWNKPEDQDPNAGPTNAWPRGRRQSSSPVQDRTPTVYINTSANAMDVPTEPQGRNHDDDEGYALPQQIGTGAPRMLQQGVDGRSLPQNAFRRLKHMGSVEIPEKLPQLPLPGDLGTYGYPSEKNNKSKSPSKYPRSKAYKTTKCLCGWTTFFCILAIALAITTLVFAAIENGKECLEVRLSLILTDIIVVLIAILEWIMMWMWREPSIVAESTSTSKAKRRMRNTRLETSMSMGPIGTSDMLTGNGENPSVYQDNGTRGTFLTVGFQDRLYDGSKIMTTFVLIVLYVLVTSFAIFAIAASSQVLTACKIVAPMGMAFGALAVLLTIIRLFFCCCSPACNGFRHLVSSGQSRMKNDMVPIVAVNKLHRVLPGLGSQLSGGNQTRITQSSAWLENLAAASDPQHNLSMVQPMPLKYANEMMP